jgi:hypothetical protein
VHYGKDPTILDSLSNKVSGSSHGRIIIVRFFDWMEKVLKFKCKIEFLILLSISRKIDACFDVATLYIIPFHCFVRYVPYNTNA